MTTTYQNLLTFLLVKTELHRLQYERAAEMLDAVIAEERERLRPWLDHRWKCAVNRMCPSCDCGWDAEVVAMGWRKP